MSVLRNFKLESVLGKDAALALRTNPAFVVFIKSITQRIQKLSANDSVTKVFNNIFLGHIQFNGVPLPVTIRLGEQLALVDNFAQQEGTNPKNIEKILTDKETGLIYTSKFLMPLFNHTYSNGIEESNCRHRTLALAIIAYCVASALKKEGYSNAIELVEAQELSVVRMSYNLNDSLCPLPLKVKNEYQPSTHDKAELDLKLDGYAILAANGSRTPQDGEKESVLLTSLGVNPRDTESVFRGYRNGIIKPDVMLRFVASNSLYAGGNYAIMVSPGLKVKQYNQFFSSTVKKAVGALVKALWHYQPEDKYYPARHLLSGCVNAQPVKKDKGVWNTPAPKQATANTTVIMDAVEAMLEVRTMADWVAMLPSFDFRGLQNSPDTELNLLELATQLAHTVEGSDTILDRLYRASNKQVTACSYLDMLIAAIDESMKEDGISGIELFLGYMPDEEDEESEEESSDTVAVSVDDFDFEDL